MDVNSSDTTDNFAQPINYRNDFKVVMLITFTILALCIISAIVITNQSKSSQRRKDLYDNISQKIQVIQVSQPLFIQSHTYFDKKMFCQQNTNTPNCSTKDLSIKQLEAFDLKLNEVINKIVEIQTKLDKNHSLLVSPEPTPYACPETEYIDCMPDPGAAKPECETNYLQWAKKNCPNFKGAAL